LDLVSLLKGLQAELMEALLSEPQLWSQPRGSVCGNLRKQNEKKLRLASSLSAQKFITDLS